MVWFESKEDETVRLANEVISKNISSVVGDLAECVEDYHKKNSIAKQRLYKFGYTLDRRVSPFSDNTEYRCSPYILVKGGARSRKSGPDWVADKLKVLLEAYHLLKPMEELAYQGKLERRTLNDTLTITVYKYLKVNHTDPETKKLHLDYVLPWEVQLRKHYLETDYEVYDIIPTTHSNPGNLYQLNNMIEDFERKNEFNSKFATSLSSDHDFDKILLTKGISSEQQQDIKIEDVYKILEEQ